MKLVNSANGIPSFQHASLNTTTDSGLQIRHSFFTAKGGVSSGVYTSLNCGLESGDEPNHIIENRRRAAESLGFSAEKMFGLCQIHSAVCVFIDANSNAEIDGRIKADAMVTKTANNALAILTADCVPVLLAAPSSGLVGAVHAGWRGAVGGVLDATIEMMIQQGAAPLDIIAVIGPAIKQDHYQVGSDLKSIAVSKHPDADVFFKPDTQKKYLFDLAGFTNWRLRSSGLIQIHDISIDTYSESSNLFSHRRATQSALADSGRQISVIGLLE